MGAVLAHPPLHLSQNRFPCGYVVCLVRNAEAFALRDLFCSGSAPTHFVLPCGGAPYHSTQRSNNQRSAYQITTLLLLFFSTLHFFLICCRMFSSRSFDSIPTTPNKPSKVVFRKTPKTPSTPTPKTPVSKAAKTPGKTPKVRNSLPITTWV